MFLNLFMIPFIGGGLLGGTGGGAVKAGVKKTLGGVDAVVGYIWIFLYVMSALVLLFLLIWSAGIVLKMARRRRFVTLITLLHQIQADLVFLKSPQAFDKDQLLSYELSEKETIGAIKKHFDQPFFLKKFGIHAHRRISDALDLMEAGKISTQDQTTLIGHWLKTIDLLS